MDVRWPTEQVTFVAKELSTGSFQKYQGSEDDVCVCVCVCALVKALSVSTLIKEPVFCNFYLAYLPCRLQPLDITRRVGYTTSYSVRSCRIFRGINRPGCEADNSLLSSAEFKKTCSYSYTAFVTSWPIQGKRHLHLHFYLYCTHNIILQYISLSSR